mmetsp:Transcript_7783/g.23677  ORF Transcript_7783/g.23677 Transcript_7783/m.23677 type:complete len:82 (-) Transcript_7783:67-312(-)
MGAQPLAATLTTYDLQLEHGPRQAVDLAALPSMWPDDATNGLSSAQTFPEWRPRTISWRTYFRRAMIWLSCLRSGVASTRS